MMLQKSASAGSASRNPNWASAWLSMSLQGAFFSSSAPAAPCVNMRPDQPRSNGWNSTPVIRFASMTARPCLSSRWRRAIASWCITGAGREVPETELSDTLSFCKPEDRLYAGQVDENSAFELRLEALRRRHQIRHSPVRGLIGSRIELIPHQLYIAHEVAGRVLPRVLLADEVGLGKTIEACLVLHRLHRSGRAGRILILVPEPLVHQWFVELLRRFNLLVSIFDEERCTAIEAGEPGANPFLDDQVILCPLSLLSQSATRGEQAARGGMGSHRRR